MTESEAAKDRVDALTDAVGAALDDLLGPTPTVFVEEQAEPKSPSDENEAMAHLYRSPSRLYGLG